MDKESHDAFTEQQKREIKNLKAMQKDERWRIIKLIKDIIKKERKCMSTDNYEEQIVEHQITIETCNRIISAITEKKNENSESRKNCIKDYDERNICEYCRKPIRWFELSSRIFVHNLTGGEHHGAGCSYIMRGTGALLKLSFILLVLLPIGIIGIIIYPFIIFKRVLFGEGCECW